MLKGIVLKSKQDLHFQQVLFVLGRGFYRGFILSVLADN